MATVGGEKETRGFPDNEVARVERRVLTECFQRPCMCWVVSREQSNNDTRISDSPQGFA
jgi:hypothetical protein